MEEIQFYKCATCNIAVSKWDIAEFHGCPKCSNNKLRKANLSFGEKIMQIIKHPKVWRWGDANYR